MRVVGDGYRVVAVLPPAAEGPMLERRICRTGIEFLGPRLKPCEQAARLHLLEPAVGHKLRGTAGRGEEADHERQKSGSQRFHGCFSHLRLPSEQPKGCQGAAELVPLDFTQGNPKSGDKIRDSLNSSVPSIPRQDYPPPLKVSRCQAPLGSARTGVVSPFFHAALFGRRFRDRVRVQKQRVFGGKMIAALLFWSSFSKISRTAPSTGHPVCRLPVNRLRDSSRCAFLWGLTCAELSKLAAAKALCRERLRPPDHSGSPGPSSTNFCHSFRLRRAALLSIRAGLKEALELLDGLNDNLFVLGRLQLHGHIAAELWQVGGSPIGCDSVEEFNPRSKIFRCIGIVQRQIAVHAAMMIRNVGVDNSVADLRCVPNLRRRNIAGETPMGNVQVHSHKPR